MSWRYRSRFELPATPLPLTYEVHLPRFNSETLKRMATTLTGSSTYKLDKNACSASILKALADPNCVRALVQRLHLFERAGLGLLKLRGQAAPTEEIAIELLMLGLPYGGDTGKRSRAYWQEGSYYEALNCLLNKGLVLLRGTDTGYWYSLQARVDQYHHSPEVFADRKLLAQVDAVPPARLTLTPASGIERGVSKQPAEVVLRFIALAEVLRKLGRIDFTAKGRPTKPFLAKLTKMLGWNDALDTESATPLPEASLFFFKLLEGAGLFSALPSGSGIGLDAAATALFESSYEAQAATWVRAYRSLTGWIEYKPESVWVDEDRLLEIGKFNGLRAALLTALAALPDPTAWYRIKDLSDGIYGRIGERFSLDYLEHFYSPFNAKLEQVNEERRKWQARIRARWVKVEQPWFISAIMGPLFYLGLVELSPGPHHEKSGPSLFRLTELGQAATHDLFRVCHRVEGAARTARRPARARGDPSRDADRCWVVQPNFDVIVYLDRAPASRLTFIERIAERQPSDGATARYHLTRETVYSALESGIDPETLIDTLTRACEYQLPENVGRTLIDWISRRERLVVYRSADVLEFVDREARDASLAENVVTGRPIGDQLLLLSGQKRLKTLVGYVSRVSNYLEPVSRCVSVSEDGLVQIDPARADLVVRGEIACWADPVIGQVEGPSSVDDIHWRMTRSTIQRAVRRGWTAESIIESLSQRAEQDLPPLFIVALRAWAGARTISTSAAIASDLILQVAGNDVAEAISASAMLQPYLRGRLGPNTFLVRHNAAEALCVKLEEFGLHVGSDLEFEGLNHEQGV